MHRCYKVSNTIKPAIGLCCEPMPKPNPDPKGYPESVRMSSEICEKPIVTVSNSQSCLYTTSIKPPPNLPPNKIQIPVVPTSSLPVVLVETTSASSTVSQKKNAVLFFESDPYNPATRFSQYFPPAPIPYQCPERIPNNDTKPSTAPCIPITRFQGSTKK